MRRSIGAVGRMLCANCVHGSGGQGASGRCDGRPGIESGKPACSPRKRAAEKAAARWSIILENAFGIYAYDMDSLGYDPVKDVAVRHGQDAFYE
jgi:hypothetical protein